MSKMSKHELLICDKFRFPTKEELICEGWEEDTYGELFHEDCGEIIVPDMYNQFGGKIITVAAFGDEGCYYIAEDNEEFQYPLDFLQEQFENYEIKLKTADHKCVEGMTPIGNWAICKVCGENMRELK